ncbi:hypothetical protein MMC25_006209 [Agyrium rufum]|nr:hypothetical protein [Agyrium rufum]
MATTELTYSDVAEHNTKKSSTTKSTTHPPSSTNIRKPLPPSLLNPTQPTHFPPSPPIPPSPHSPFTTTTVPPHPPQTNVPPSSPSYSGGEEVLLDVGGQDATEAFEDVGHSDEAREILENLLVGPLQRQPGDPAPKTAPPAGATSNAANATGSASGAGLGVGLYVFMILGLVTAGYVAWSMTVSAGAEK